MDSNSYVTPRFSIQRRMTQTRQYGEPYSWYEALQLKQFVKMGRDFVNTFRGYQHLDEFKKDGKSVIKGFQKIGLGFRDLIGFALLFLTTITLIWPIIHAITRPTGEKLATFFNYPRRTLELLWSSLIYLLRGLSLTAAFFSGLTPLKIAVRLLISYNFPQKIDLLDDVKHILKDISKDFRNTKDTYKGKSYFYNDAFQFFDGIYNTGKGFIYLLESIIMLALTCTLILPLGMFFVKLADSQQPTVGAKLREAAGALAYFPYSAALTFLNGSAHLFRGLTEIISYPLTVVKICARSFITWWKYGKGYQPIQENTDVQQLVEAIRKTMTMQDNQANSSSTIQNLLMDPDFCKNLGKLERKFKSYQEKGQAPAVEYSNGETTEASVQHEGKSVYLRPLMTNVDKGSKSLTLIQDGDNYYDFTKNKDSLTLDEVQGRLEYFTLVK